MLQIPLGAVPSQQVSLNLANQNVVLNVYQLANGKLYMDVISNNQPIITCRPCQYGTLMLEDAKYWGFVGDFTWVDLLSGVSTPPTDPVYTGLADQYQLIYLEASDLQ